MCGYCLGDFTRCTLHVDDANGDADDSDDDDDAKGHFSIQLIKLFFHLADVNGAHY